MSGQTDDEDCEELRMVAVDMFGWVGLVSLTDRRKSVGTEDGRGIGEDNIGA